MAKRGRPKKSKFDEKKMGVIVLLLIVVIFGISVAYAALSTTLTITASKVTQSALTWNVAFQTGTVTGTPGGSSGEGRSCGNATVTANTVTVAQSTLSKPEDSCTYALVIKNTGSIDANLATITPVAPTSTSCTNNGASMVCGNITYKLTTDLAGNTLLTPNRILAKTSGSLNVYLVMKYTGASINSSDVTQNNGGFTLVYNQA